MVEELIFINPIKDFVFKTMWLHSSLLSRNYLKRVINSIVKIDLDNYYDGMQEIGSNTYKGILSRTDILLVRKDKKIKFNIEVNKEYKTATINKNKTYIYKIGGNFYNDMDTPYKEEIKVIQLNINGYGNKEIEHFYLYDKQHKKIDKSIEIYHLYLGKYKGICYDKVNDIYNDYALLMCESYEEMEKYIGDNKERRSFMEDLKKLGSNESFANLFNREEYLDALRRIDLEESLNKGLNKGIKKGKKEGINEILNCFLEHGMSKQEIYEITGIKL